MSPDTAMPPRVLKRVPGDQAAIANVDEGDMPRGMSWGCGHFQRPHAISRLEQSVWFPIDLDEVGPSPRSAARSGAESCPRPGSSRRVQRSRPRPREIGFVRRPRRRHGLRVHVSMQPAANSLPSCLAKVATSSAGEDVVLSTSVSPSSSMTT